MMAGMTRSKGQVYSVGNYLMTGKVLGKGHFAKVEEATHRVIGKKVAIKIIDLTCIKEDYARRNLHREPRVMSKLRHPCIAALYETMMHGPRLYVVMEAAGGGDLCSHVLAARGAARGLPETRAKALAAQLVSAVRHMHARGVVHRDLKMENIMLDTTKQFIKIVDFGLSNIWSAGAALRTPCGSLEYAAPELFVDGRRYGPEVDLWSIGVIVYGMVTGGLPFAGAGEAGSRPQLRAAIARGVTRTQRAALAPFTTECKTFIQHLLEPRVEQRMKIEEAARHRWVKRPGMRMKTHPFANVDPKINREMYRQLAELSGKTFLDIVAQIKAEPFGATAGMYNIKIHLHQLQAVPGADLLWSSSAQESRPMTPPEYQAKCDVEEPTNSQASIIRQIYAIQPIQPIQPTNVARARQIDPKPPDVLKPIPKPIPSVLQSNPNPTYSRSTVVNKAQSPGTPSRPLNMFGLKKPIFKVYENGDGLDPRLPSINEHSNTDVAETKKLLRKNDVTTCVRKMSLDEPMRLNSCPERRVDMKTDFYKRAGDGLPTRNWRSCGIQAPSARLLLQSNATTINRASLGNIVSPHSSSNSHCKSEKAMPVGWYSTRPISKETHLQRLRRTAPMK